MFYLPQTQLCHSFKNLIFEKDDKLTLFPGAILYRCQIEEESDIHFRECCGCYLSDSVNSSLRIIYEKRNLSEKWNIHSYRVIKFLYFYKNISYYNNIDGLEVFITQKYERNSLGYIKTYDVSIIH
jgi:hypothetical protein